jgi:hypothetical protein
MPKFQQTQIAMTNRLTKTPGLFFFHKFNVNQIPFIITIIKSIGPAVQSHDIAVFPSKISPSPVNTGMNKISKCKNAIKPTKLRVSQNQEFLAALGTSEILKENGTSILKPPRSVRFANR